MDFEVCGQGRDGDGGTLPSGQDDSKKQPITSPLLSTQTSHPHFLTFSYMYLIKSYEINSQTLDGPGHFGQDCEFW